MSSNISDATILPSGTYRSGSPIPDSIPYMILGITSCKLGRPPMIHTLVLVNMFTCDSSSSNPNVSLPV